MISRASRRALVALACAFTLLPVPPALATTEPPPEPPVVEAPSVPLSINVDRTLIDYGGTINLNVFGPVGATVRLFGNGRQIRTATIGEFEGDATGVASFTLQPGDRTLFYAIVEGQQSAAVTVEVRRTVTIGISQANGVYTFRGQIARPEPFVQVTIARLDATTKRVTGVASTSTQADGTYVIRTALPVGQAGYYALTGVTNTGRLQAGRSRLYGLIVPARRPATPTPTIPTVSLSARGAGGNAYTLSGRLTPGRSVPVTLAEVRGGRLVGILGGRASANGSYSFRVTLNREARPTTRTFQVLSAAGQGLRAGSSRRYGIAVPARAVVVNPAAETVSQRNARLSAAQYLELLAFSRSGLIEQLEDFEGYSRADATYGVDAQRANWSQQAARSARQYLEVLPFSRSELIRQLVDFEGFTTAEATFGVNAVGL